jgi:uncharacterized protein YndB with AHSA1/START domain
MSKLKETAEALADQANGQILAHVEIAASPERVFQALASKEVCDWWVRPGVFNTVEWSGDVRIGGRYRATGTARGEAYAIEGQFLEIDPPRKLVMTWHRVGTPGEPTVITYTLEKLDGGTRLSLRHTGFTSAENLTNVAAGWKTSFDKLADRVGR